MKDISPHHEITETETEDRLHKRPLRILVAGPSLDILGGQSRQAALLCSWLSRQPNVSVSFVPHNPRLPGGLRWLQQLKYVRTVVTSLWYWALLLIRVRQCDVLHVFSASYYSYLLSAMPALLVAKWYDKKSILNYHSGEAEDHLKNWPRTAGPTMQWASLIVVQSGYLKAIFGQFRLDATIIPSSVNLERFHFRQRDPLRPIFLSNRLHEPLYNVACIVRAFAIIQRHRADARLIIAGDGTERAELERLAAELKLTGVEFIGRVEYAQMPSVYDSADIYLNSPNLDNFPNSIMESFAAGLPVVTTDAGGIPYLVSEGETGFLVGCGDHSAMAEKALRLLADQNLASRIAQQAREECEQYSAEHEQRRWMEVYQNLMLNGARSQQVQITIGIAE
ncbi:MAG TPA: glycosyltransferase family 4 protein [Blastocatellia bacterium]|nr:glycosyltransferase family 4 protein [Blastocatellia bacterium]